MMFLMDLLIFHLLNDVGTSISNAKI